MDWQKIGLLVGIEVHQQLLTSQKLFCNCVNCDDDNVYKKIF
jgi:Glu-tRNA(Gln) amidotransferase subunit E-like FAD-binding protein